MWRREDIRGVWGFCRIDDVQGAEDMAVGESESGKLMMKILVLHKIKVLGRDEQRPNQIK